jgi:hypothetical protein
VSADPFWLCLFLDAKGCPCNRRTMRPLSMCALHREAPASKPRTASRAEYQRNRRATQRTSGVAAAWETA